MSQESDDLGFPEATVDVGVEEAPEMAVATVEASDAPEETPAPTRRISPELAHDPYGEEEMDITRGDFEAMLEEFGGEMQHAREGEIVTARVLSLTETAVILEFGFKSEGSVRSMSSRTRPSSHPGSRWMSF